MWMTNVNFGDFREFNTSIKRTEIRKSEFNNTKSNSLGFEKCKNYLIIKSIHFHHPPSFGGGIFAHFYTHHIFSIVFPWLNFIKSTWEFSSFFFFFFCSSSATLISHTHDYVAVFLKKFISLGWWGANEKLIFFLSPISGEISSNLSSIEHFSFSWNIFFLS